VRIIEVAIIEARLHLYGYRMRVGEYRMLFDRNEEIIVIHHISKRADAY